MTKNRISREFSAKAANMSLLGALLVVSIHCGFAGQSGVWCQALNLVFANAIARVAVPFFFLLSGYFLAGHVGEEGWWKRETGKRLRSLVVPFFLWIALYYVLFIPLMMFLDHEAGRALGTTWPYAKYGILRIVGLKWDDWPAVGPLWFIRALFVYVLFSPLIVRALKLAPKSYLVLLAVGFVALEVYAPDPKLGGWSGFLQRFISLQGLLYFSLGFYARFADVRFTSKRLAVGSLLIALGLLFANGYIILKGSNSRLFAYAAVPFLMYGLWVFMPATELPSFLKGVAFPIYLMHFFFIYNWYFISATLGINADVARPISWPITVVICILLANVLRSLTPKVFSVLFGGRG